MQSDFPSNSDSLNNELGSSEASFNTEQTSPSVHMSNEESLRGFNLSLDPLQQKILVIDDSKTIRKTAENLLTREGFNVCTAEDGFEALAAIVKHRPELIFIDIMMPRLDGYQTCSLIKNHPEYKTIPVVMLSSKDGLFDKAKGKIVGANDYLTKPFGKEDLLNTVNRFLNFDTSNESQAASA